MIHGAPITDMSSYKQNLVSCDESGYTVLSKLDSGELMIIARSKMFGGLVKLSQKNTVISSAPFCSLIKTKNNFQI